MDPEQARGFADRILELVPAEDPLGERRHFHHDRKRIELYLEGLEVHAPTHPVPSRLTWVGNDCKRCHVTYPCGDAERYIDALTRVGRVYGVAP